MYRCFKCNLKAKIFSKINRFLLHKKFLNDLMRLAFVAIINRNFIQIIVEKIKYTCMTENFNVTGGGWKAFPTSQFSNVNKIMGRMYQR